MYETSLFYDSCLIAEIVRIIEKGVYMNFSQYLLFSDQSSSDDDIDNLFRQLQTIEPPESLVENILASVTRLSRHQLLSSPSAATCISLPAVNWKDVEGLIVHNENQEPS